MPHDHTRRFTDEDIAAAKAARQVVTISAVEYGRLKAAEKELQRLEANGVDNWEGYSLGLEDETEAED